MKILLIGTLALASIVGWEIPGIISLLLFYLLTFSISRFKYNLDRKYFSFGILCCIAAYAFSFFVALLHGNNISFIFRYSGGLLLLPLYFFLLTLGKANFYMLVKYIFAFSLFFSLVSILYLISTLFYFQELASVLRAILGYGSGSGFNDTRFYSITNLSICMPISIILIIVPRSFSAFMGINSGILSRVFFLRLYGFLTGMTGLALLFSKSTIIYLVFLSVLIVCTSFNNLLSFRLNKRLLSQVPSIFILILLVGIPFFHYTDPSRLIEIFNPFDENYNIARYEQMNYIVTEGISFLGDGLGASLEGTPILRSIESPYGLENSIINVILKFGFFSILFLPFLFYCFIAPLTFMLTKNIHRQHCYSEHVTMLANVALFSYSYFIIFSIGNPVLFHTQLNFLLLVFGVFYTRSSFLPLAEPN